MHNTSSMLFKKALSITQSLRYRNLINKAKTPGKVQTDLLRRILKRNSNSEFGKAHGFSSISCTRDYQRAVPVQTYEDLRPYIERQELTGERCLTRDQPVYYHRTSGTLGTPKNIPVTEIGLRQMKGDQKISALVWSRCKGVLDGKIFAVSGQAVEGMMPGGTEFGSASGLLYRSQSPLVRSRYVLPPALSEIEDYDSRYLAMAIFGFADAEVTSMATANPSTFLRLLSFVHSHADVVFNAIATGKLPDMPVSGLEPRPARARQLADKLQSSGRLTYTDIWPNLRGVVTWTGGSCGIALGSLSPLLPANVAIIEWGYSASEFRGTINIDAKHNTCLPTLITTFFEFMERQERETGGGDFLGLDELQEGHEYYVFITTIDGLYRYDINDIVRVNGRVFETPALEFVQKGKGVTNITGEKLTEAQVIQAVMSVLSDYGISPMFFIMLACEESAVYRLFIELNGVSSLPGLAMEIENTLYSVNIEYEAKRKSGRLAPLGIRYLENGTGDRYRSACVEAGQRDAQFKYLHLQYARDCTFDFDSAAGLE